MNKGGKRNKDNWVEMKEIMQGESEDEERVEKVDGEEGA